MPEFEVIAEFIDATTKARKKPGDKINVSGKRIERLKAAGVIGEEIIPAKPAAPKKTAAKGGKANETKNSKPTAGRTGKSGGSKSVPKSNTRS